MLSLPRLIVSVRARRACVAGAVFSLALLATGCGTSRYPVEGRVLLNGKPLQGKEGAVVLKPDASKGNTSTVTSVGVLQRDGSFSVLTNGQPGAPPGWYKVIVMATEAAANPNEDTRRVANMRYESEEATPLAFEVVANPTEGTYDLQLSR
jgi:hypothetical protein